MILTDTVKERIAIMRPLLILGVVYVHTGGIGDSISWEWSNPFEYLVATLRNGLFRAAVPMLTLISGFLLFGAALDQHPAKMMRKKARTLVIPFLVFNFAFVALMLPLEVFFGFAHRVPLTGVDFLGWLDRLFALRGTPFNMPLYFLRDMVVLVILAPLFGYLLRKVPVLGLVAVSVVFYFDLDSYLVLRSTSAILFYIGGLAAIYRWNLETFDRYATLCAVFILAACLAFVAMRGEKTLWLALTLPFLLWPASALLHGTRIAAWALKYNHYSFFVFVAHFPLMFLGWQFILHYARFVPFPVYFVFSPLVTVAFLMVVYNLLMRVAPRAFSTAIGNRTKRQESAGQQTGVEKAGLPPRPAR